MALPMPPAFIKKLIQLGAVSLALYFHYGNAEFKFGKSGPVDCHLPPGVAIGAAQRRGRANLEFVRNPVRSPIFRENHWQDWLRTLTLDERTELAATAL